MRLQHLAPAVLVVALCSCGQGENSPGPGGVTSGEARALDEAAEMIEQRRLPDAALRPPVAVPSASGQPGLAAP